MSARLTRLSHILQRAFELSEAGDLLLRIGEVAQRDLFGRTAVRAATVNELQQRADIVEPEPEFAAAADKAQSLNIAFIVRIILDIDSDRSGR